jgi:hypothetical protein
MYYLLSDVHPSTFGHRRTEFDHLLQPKLELVQVRLVLLKGGPKLGRIGETFGKTHNGSHLQRNFNIYERKEKNTKIKAKIGRFCCFSDKFIFCSVININK